MPALVNYSGDDEFYSGGSVYSMDSSLLRSIGSHLDMYCPPSKRARISSPFASSGDMFEEERKPSIEVLPDECLFEIFRRLPGGQARSASACVSKHWLALLSSVRNSEICKNVSKVNESSNDVDMVSCEEGQEMECDGYLTRSLEGKKATDIRLAAIAVGTASRGGLGKLSIRGSNPIRGVTNKGLSAIAHGCPSLKVLSLWDVSYVGDEGMYEIAKECHLLEKLDLCQCPSISNKGLIAIAMNSPKLTALTIDSCRNIGNESLQAIGRCCPKLQSITIKDCPHIGDQGVASLVSSTSSSLTKVKLQGLSLTDFSLAVIGHCGKDLTSLIFSGLQNVTEKGFWVMGNAQGLEKLATLSITSCRGTTDVCLEAIGKGCRNLKQMCLHKCCFVSDSGLIAFAKAAVSLESLQLEECNRITQLGIVGALLNCGSKVKSLALVKCMGIKDLDLETPFLSPCESLRSLSIRSCPGFGSVSLALVGNLCPQLHQLDLSGLCGITDSGLLPLVEGCDSGLVKVNLAGCLNLTDEVVSALARLHGGTLEVLNLDGCIKVTDASLVALADHCLVLSDLEMSKCSITDTGIASLSCGEQLNLQVLSISGCNKVSNKSMPYLRKLGRTLVGLNLQQCNSISTATVDLLVESLWRCDILS
ncbi:EIN3-binding F-box protein 1-like [Actinidia eriantha]|uniref:EIN3-binding F-box protein 1-like n=1 Tax=Actinidia eriantha TaxID=165200 RepID=UPI002587862C|nr:EIN3-binding F-box protein 1-like [Actinidia eriantha]